MCEMLSSTKLSFFVVGLTLVHAIPAFQGLVIDSKSNLLDSYDYVVVGAGASGLTVANRLSEDVATTVLVVEAGSFDLGEDFITVPGLAGGAVGTQYDWNISYVPTKAVYNRSVSIPQGKVVGGSTKLNRMVFDRGSKSDYNRWETLGNDGWGWDSLLPYFKKNEIFTPPNAYITTEYNVTYTPAAHGSSGYMNVSYSPFVWPTTKNMVNAVKELGIPISSDQANGEPIGGYYCPHNQDPRNATRSSAREAYYDSCTRRQNLHLLPNQQVTRILTSTSAIGIRVSGVEYSKAADAQKFKVSVTKEVIMAAGAIFTPQILQISGIGDPAHLAAINVSTVVDLPAVGQNFQDHVYLTTVNSISAPLTSANLTSNTTFAAEARRLYSSEHVGPYSSPGGDFLAFLPLSTYSNQSSAIHAVATAQDPAGFLPTDAPPEVVRGYKSQHEVLNDKLNASDSAILELIWADGVVVLGLEHPYSRGSVKAATSNIFKAPRADAALLANPLDVAILTEGVKFLRVLTKTTAISELQPFEVLPGANVTSDADIANFIRQTSTTLYHPAGSCKMGARENGGVVDGKLKVYGISGLRIVDASIMPLLPASHIMTTVYAVAEKAADIIRGVV